MVGRIYDATAPRGMSAQIGELELWWKLRNDDLGKPYLTGKSDLRPCVCGRTESIRFFIKPKSPLAMPSADMFHTILTKSLAKNETEPMDEL